MPMPELLAKLEMIARKNINKREYPPYALSADNLLKMALILLRTRARIPVVLCGEAGKGMVNEDEFCTDVTIHILTCYHSHRLREGWCSGSRAYMSLLLFLLASNLRHIFLDIADRVSCQYG